jgi:copper oxidase (laccase) domain-containing protein
MSNRSIEDQVAAMEAGFTSTTDWAISELIKRYQDLDKRVSRLEVLMGGDIAEPDPED